LLNKFQTLRPIPNAGIETMQESRARSILAVPMLKAGRPVGAVARPQTRYFPERQLELLRTFPAQAVM
jgi:GAF domain-containing protein